MWTLSLPYPNLSSFDLASIDRRSDLYVWLLLNTFLTKVYSSVSVINFKALQGFYMYFVAAIRYLNKIETELI